MPASTKLTPEMMLLDSLPKVENKFIGTGVQGNLNTVKFLQEIAHLRKVHPIVRELALNILLSKNIPSQDHLSEAIALGEYVKNKVRYVKDIYDVETVYDPLTLISRIVKGTAQADCDDHVLLLCSLLLSVGIQPYVKIVKYKGSSNYNHIYVVVYERNHNDRQAKRIVLDTIVKTRPMGYEVPHVSGKEIRV